MILGLEVTKKRSRHWPWFAWMTSVVVLSSAFTPSTDRCDVAQSRCVQNPTCLPLLRRYLTFCSDLIDGPVSSVCWPRCRRTLPLLLDIPDGRAFVGCDCQLNAHCLEQRQRLQSCSRGFGSSPVNPSRPTGKEEEEATTCSEAKKSCIDDKACQDALTIANVVCSGVERRGRCDRTCRNSLRTLYSINHGRQLRSCRCDDLKPDPEMCSALRQNTKTLCHKRRSKHPVTTDRGAITITPSTGTDRAPPSATAHRHLLNASMDLRLFQRSGADITVHSGTLVTEGTLRTASGSTGEKSVKDTNKNARIHASAATSHVEEVEIKMAAASNSAWKCFSHWIIICSNACWILSLSALRVDCNR